VTFCFALPLCSAAVGGVSRNGDACLRSNVAFSPDVVYRAHCQAALLWEVQPVLAWRRLCGLPGGGLCCSYLYLLPGLAAPVLRTAACHAQPGMTPTKFCFFMQNTWLAALYSLLLL